MAAKPKAKPNNPPVKRSGRGGYRGGGRPKGSLELKARTLIEVKNRIAQKADDLLNAELAEGLGVNVVLKLDEVSKKYEPVTDPKEIIEVINEHKGASGSVNDKHYIVAARPGNYKAREYLFDRAFGRPAQSVEVTTDPEILKLKSLIELRAKEKGVDYTEELRNYVDHYAPPPIREKLVSELVQ